MAYKNSSEHSAGAPRSLAGIVASLLVLLSACDDGSVTTLDAMPEVVIPLPTFLFDEDFLDEDNLRPIVELSNGEVLSINQDGDERFTGVITVTTGQVLTATITWVERFEGIDLPLARGTQDLSIGDDGSAILLLPDDFSYDISLDFDSDGQSNLAERQAGTDPLNQ